jgi:hypothetical protein
MTPSRKTKRLLTAVAYLLFLSACAANGHDASGDRGLTDDSHEVDWKNGELDLNSAIDWDKVKRELHRKYKRNGHSEHTGNGSRDHKLGSEVTLTLKLKLNLSAWDDGISDHPVHCVNESISTVEIVGITQPRRIGTENCI